MNKEMDKPESPAGDEPPAPRKQYGRDDCRCKEVSEKSPVGLFRLMLSDLLFRKKTDEEKRKKD